MTGMMPKMIHGHPDQSTLPFALMLGITAFLTLVSIGLYRYGKFRIEVVMYKRKHGEMVKEQEAIQKEKNDLQNLSDKEIVIKRETKEDDGYTSITTPTSNLVNNVDKEQKN
jgi:hypothetical protein